MENGIVPAKKTTWLSVYKMKRACVKQEQAAQQQEDRFEQTTAGKIRQGVSSGLTLVARESRVPFATLSAKILELFGKIPRSVELCELEPAIADYCTQALEGLAELGNDDAALADARICLEMIKRHRPTFVRAAELAEHRRVNYPSWFMAGYNVIKWAYVEKVDGTRGYGYEESEITVKKVVLEQARKVCRSVAGELKLGQ